MKLSSTRVAFIFCLFHVVIFSPHLAFTQFSGGGLPASFSHNLSLDHVPILSFPLSSSQALSEDQLGVYKSGTPVRAGYVIRAEVAPENHGYREVIENHTRILRLRIQSPGALAIGLHLDAFELPKGAKLYFYTPDRSMILGYFSHLNNNASELFSTGIVPGQEIIMEYQEPYNAAVPLSTHQLPFRLESVVHIGYSLALGLNATLKQAGNSGPCNVDVNCPEGADWQDEKRGVALMLMRIGDGVFYCTGSLINNTGLNGDPLFLTAAHCTEGATARDKLFWHFYFNFENQGCNRTGVSLHHLLVGANQLATGPLQGGSDFSLLRLRQNPPAHWQLYWNGWDRSGNVSTSGVGIHHPEGDEKKISTYTTSVATATPSIDGARMATNSAWSIRWAPTQSGHGITEGGSSGSPLFNAAGLIIGTLAGGSSSCATLLGNDYYGRLFYHWDRNGTQASQRLAPHLDPLGTGVSQLLGFAPHTESFPPPGHITATLQQNQQAEIRWWPPGTFPNPAGWFSHRNTAHFVSMSTPERAVFFEAPLLGLSYPISLEAIRHRFFEIPTRLWTSDRFEFIVYDSDGTTIIHRSPVLTASKIDWTQYTLPQTLQINRPFYIAIRPVGTGGFPSSGGMQVNYGQSFSFIGNAGYWEQPEYFADRSGALCYLTGIRVGGTLPAGTGYTNPETSSWISAEGVPAPLVSAHKDLELLSPAAPAGYRLYRNNVLIHTASATGPLNFTDTAVPMGLIEYRATATFPNNVESARSATTYLLRAEACPYVISTFPYLQNFPTGFTAQCWTQSGTTPWQLSASRLVGTTTINPVQREQFYNLQTAVGAQTNQWLILPVVNMATLAQPALRFRFNGIFRSDGPRLRVWAGVSEGHFSLVWDSHAHPVFARGASNLQWLSATINLRELANRNAVRIAFQFTGNGEGFYALDVIELLSAAQITHNLTLNANPEFTGMVAGQGSFLAGQTVTVHATPNAGSQFGGWFSGTTLQSLQPTFSFVMPAANLNLTASFTTVPTSVHTPNELQTGYDVFPNPSRGGFNIRFHEPLPHALITLYDTQGRVIRQKATGPVQTGQIEHFSAEGAPAGVYLLKIQTTFGVEMKRIMISW